MLISLLCINPLMAAASELGAPEFNPHLSIPFTSSASLESIEVKFAFTTVDQLIRSPHLTPDLTHKERIESAIVLLIAVAMHEAATSEDLLQAAEKLYRLKQTTQSLAIYARVACAPFTHPTLRLLAIADMNQIYIDCPRFTRNTEIIISALVQASNSELATPEQKLESALLLRQMGESEAALTIYTAIVNSEITTLTQKLTAANAAKEMGSSKAFTIKLYETIVNNTSNLTDAHIGAARCLAALKPKDQAALAYLSLSMRPISEPSHAFKLASELQRLGYITDAKRLYEHTIDLSHIESALSRAAETALYKLNADSEESDHRASPEETSCCVA